MSLDVEHLSYCYDEGREAVADVSLSVPDGGLRCLLGATGSGKSTLVKCLCGLLRPDAGDVRVDGRPVWQPRRFRQARRDPQLFRRVGYVMQRPERQLFAETVLEDVAFGPKNLGVPEEQATEQARAALDALHIGAVASRSPFELSGGQQRLAAIAGILAMGPKNLVMDEPMGSLDPSGRAIVRDAVRELHGQGVTILMVTHDMDDVASLADAVTVLDRGAVVLEGAPAEVFAQGQQLHDLGLGLPSSVAFAERLRAAGGPDLGLPLTTEALADALAPWLADGTKTDAGNVSSDGEVER